MIDLNRYRKSSYMKAADPTATRTKVRVAKASEEEVGMPAVPKVVLQFTTTTLKPMIVNYTNLITLVDAFGPDETTWVGKLIVLFKTKTPFQGRMVDTLVIEIPPQPAAAPVPPASEPPEIPEAILAEDDAELL